MRLLDAPALYITLSKVALGKSVRPATLVTSGERAELLYSLVTGTLGSV